MSERLTTASTSSASSSPVSATQATGSSPHPEKEHRMSILGPRGVTFGGHAGEFNCPGCGWTSQPYEHKTVRRFFTLYFIPVIPLDKLAEYVRCMTCGGTYQTSVLSFDPKAETDRM